MNAAEVRAYLDGQLEELDNQPWAMTEGEERKHTQMLALSIQLAQVEMLERIALQLEALNHRMEGA